MTRKRQKQAKEKHGQKQSYAAVPEEEHKRIVATLERTITQVQDQYEMAKKSALSTVKQYKDRFDELKRERDEALIAKAGAESALQLGEQSHNKRLSELNENHGRRVKQLSTKIETLEGERTERTRLELKLATIEKDLDQAHRGGAAMVNTLEDVRKRIKAVEEARNRMCPACDDDTEDDEDYECECECDRIQQVYDEALQNLFVIVAEPKPVEVTAEEPDGQS